MYPVLELGDNYEALGKAYVLTVYLRGIGSLGQDKNRQIWRNYHISHNVRLLFFTRIQASNRMLLTAGPISWGITWEVLSLYHNNYTRSDNNTAGTDGHAILWLNSVWCCVLSNSPK